MSEETTKKRGKRSNDARFPVARIKKLIQADEEVGKVAQATPVLVSKALELFLKDLVDELIKDSESRSTNKISSHSLKRVVNSNPTFDFLSDIVANVIDPLSEEMGGVPPTEEKKPLTRTKRNVNPTAKLDHALSLDQFTNEELEDQKGLKDDDDDDEDYDE